ncbi:MAG: MBL fold metallo-hydrolase [Bacteroidetes bacterium]|nr:MBL fold metallo-hydrolase [Bacteroidota bacterium]
MADRRHASLVLRYGEACVLFDAGEGVSASLITQGLDLSCISAIFISHTHCDHVAGLPLLLQGMHLAGRKTPLDIHVPPGRQEWFRRWFEGLYIFEEKWSFPFRMHCLGESVAPVDGLEITPVPNRHLEKVRALAERYGIRADSFSFRIDGPSGTAVVSSDIAVLDDIASSVADADLLIVDATHVSPSEIIDLAKQQSGLRVVCTHIPPELDAASAIATRSGGTVTVAFDGLQIDLDQER